MRIPATLKHANDAATDAELQAEARTHLEQNPGLRFLTDVLAALHAGARSSRDFFGAFPPKDVMEALAQRPDVRAKMVRAITGSPMALLRRLSAGDLATQIELLSSEDLPVGERHVRADEDRSLSVPEIYQRHLDRQDLATYLPARRIWQYEAQDSWWTQEARPATRALMLAELKSIRQHRLVSETEILDIVGDESFERDLPLPVRVTLRAAARKAGAEGKPFTDSDVFAAVRSSDGSCDLLDELAEHLPLAALRKVVARAAEVLGLEEGTGEPIRPPAIPPKKGAAKPAVAAKTPPPLAGARTPGASRPPALPSRGADATVITSARDPFASGPPVEHEILAALDDLAAPEVVITTEETAENRR